MQYQIGWAESPVFESEMADNEWNLQLSFYWLLDPSVETLYDATLEGVWMEFEHCPTDVLILLAAYLDYLPMK